MPSPPDPVPVVLNPGQRRLLIFDVIDHICAHRPNCKEQMVPAIAALLAQARKVASPSCTGTRAANMSTWLPEVSPAPGDIKIENHAQDRFYNTELDQALKARALRLSF
jgi:nicotinamidase-related amidase